MSDEPRIATPTPEEAARYGGTQGDAVGGAEAGAESPASESSEAQQWREKFLRAKADLSNYQKRAEKERTESIRYAAAELVKNLLPILDDLERLIASGTEGKVDAAKLAEGAKLLRDNFLKVLDDFHVTPIEAQGQPFDPEIHQAVMELPSPEHADRTVVQEVAKGYRMHDRVLRPARVVVAKPVQENGAGASGENETG